MKTTSREDRTGPTQSGKKPEQNLNRMIGWYPGCWPASLIGVIGLAMVFYFGVRPLLMEDVDPNLKGPDIEQMDEQEQKENEAAVRGSFTDQLFVKKEKPPEHPLDPALEIARQGLERMRREVRDYSAVMVKRERVGRKLLGEEFLRVKVRHADPDQGINKSFYVRHLKPQKMAGQEAIWIENQNDGKLVAHGAGWQKFVKVNLEPTSRLAMRGNRYPITELGIETLLIRMIEKGERDRQSLGECIVEYSRDLELDNNPCTLITIQHPKKRKGLEFHIAKIYIDDKLQLPVGYESYLWPREEGGEPRLLERYFYRELEINPGLKDLDFDPKNSDYDFP